MLNPAVRGVTDWNMLGSILCAASYCPSVPGLPHSNAAPRWCRSAAAPRCRSASACCAPTGAGASRNRCSYSSSQTGKPRPPATISDITTTFIGQSSTNGDQVGREQPETRVVERRHRVEQPVPERLPGRVVVRDPQPQRRGSTVPSGLERRTSAPRPGTNSRFDEPRAPSWPLSAAPSTRRRRPIRRPSSTRPIVARVMIPSPPTWIRSRITTCPNGDQYVPVSTDARPVTQTAEVR